MALSELQDGERELGGRQIKKAVAHKGQSLWKNSMRTELVAEEGKKEKPEED
jgi:hypothetical protein